MGTDGANESPFRKFVKKAVPVILVIAFAGYLFYDYFIDVHDGAFDDYESAGPHVKAQIDKRESEVSVRLNTGTYNPIIGYGKQLEGVLKAAMPHTGNPKEGDHLRLNVWPKDSQATSVKMSDNTYNLNMKITMEYRMTQPQQKEFEAKCASILAQLNLNGKSDYEKVRAIYGYICSHVTYDYEHYAKDPSYPLQYIAYGAAVNGTAVCSGIADLFYYLANSVGLDTRIKANGDHAWNFVKVGDKYYYLDATWDLGRSEANWRYFLKGRLDYESHTGLISLTNVGPVNLLISSDADYEISAYGYGVKVG